MEGTDLDIEPGLHAAEEAAGSRSMLDRIKARREKRGDISDPIDIPSWGGELRACYQVIAKEELEAMVRRIRARQTGQGKAGDVTADLDFLIKSCCEVQAQDAETGEEASLTNGYTMQLAELLGEPDGTDTARGLVLYLFKGNGIAVSAHAMKVARWMQDTSKSIEDPQ